MTQSLPADVGNPTTPASAEVVLTHRDPPPKKPQKTRKSTSKVKTGCLTCKYRRVKCDEGRPECNRCLKFGVNCDGYESQYRVLPRGERYQRTHMILPKRQENASCLFITSPIPKIRNGTGFEDDMESQCFRIYLEETARQIHGPFANSVWDRLIPRTSEAQPFIRHIVIAIGALGRKSLTGGSSQKGTAHYHSDYHYALKQYEKALRGMQEAIAKGQHDLCTALLACLLVFCFESMLGNQASAIIHAQRGLMLLYQFASGNKLHGKLWSQWRSDERWGGVLSERDLVQVFNTLNSQVLLFIDTRDKDVHQTGKNSANAFIQTMPEHIDDLFTARLYWQVILNRNYHFSKSIQRVDLEILQEKRKKTPWEGSANMDQTELLLSDAMDGNLPLEEEKLQYQNDIRRFVSSSSRLFNSIAIGNSQEDKVAAAIIQVQTRTSHIMLAGTFFTQETAYDIFLPEFTEIVNLAETILPHLLSTHRGSEPCFNFDISIVPALYLVGSRCRGDGVRQRAIEMLFSANLREGIWDAQAVARMARWLRSIELDGLPEGGFIPEEKRAVLSAVNADLFNKRAMLGASQKTKNGVVESKTLLTW